MRVRKRKIKENAFQHIYQNTMGGVLLFYDDYDRLVYYTAFAVTARKYQAQVLAISLMYDHTHSSVRLKDPARLGDFVRDYTSLYAIEFNRDINRHGPLFQCAYGNAPKAGAKAIRTNIAYLDTPNPFSPKIDRSHVSKRLLRSLKRVAAFSNSNAYLSYRILRSLFDGLTGEEKEQLTDHIIFTYLPLDKEELFVLYGDYENMLTAINSNTGSEYDIKEDFDNSPHTIYRDLLKVCLHSSFADNPKAMLVLRQSEKRRIADILQNKTGATFWQLKKFLGLE